MHTLLTLIITFSFLGLIIGLIMPSWVRMPSRKRAGMIFGGVWLVSFILFGITIPKGQQSSTNAVTSPAPLIITNSGVATSSNQAPVAAAVTTPAPTSSPNESNPFNDPKQNSALFIAAFPRVVVDFDAAGTDMQNAGKDLTNRDYQSAITDIQNVQYDLQNAQTQLNDAVYGPMTVDVNRINALATEAITSGLKGSSIAIADMKNADYSGVQSNALPYFATMENDYTKVQQLIAGWEVKNQ